MRVYASAVLVGLCVACPPLTGALVFAAVLYWASQCYGRRLKTQMERESDPYIQTPFVQRSTVGLRGWIPPRLLQVIGGILILAATTIVYALLTEFVFWAVGGTTYIPVEEAPTWLFLVTACGWYGVLVIVVETLNRKILKGWIFRNYTELVTYVRASRSAEDVLGYAPALRHAAKMHVRAPYDLFRIWSSRRAAEDHTAYYRSERLLEALIILEQRFPHESTDERFRQRYWSYARSIYRVLFARDKKMVEGSLFARPYSSLVSSRVQRMNLDHESATPMLSSELRVTELALNCGR